jgi:hypothetical protein
VKAFAVLTGYRDSNITSGRYETGALTALPHVSFSPQDGGIIPPRGTLEITLAVTGHGDASIFWRDKFREVAFNAYASPITVSADSTIEAYATKATYLDGQPKEARFNHANPLPTPILEPRYSAGLLIGWTVNCAGADRLFYVIDDRPGQLSFFGQWDHELHPDQGNNNGQLIKDSSGTIDGGPWAARAKGIRVMGSSASRGLSPVGSWNTL